MLILNATEVSQALPMTEAIAAMRHAMKALSSGSATIPPRTHLGVATGPGTTLVMPGYVPADDHPALVVKVVSIFNQNRQRGLPNILGLVQVLDPETGEPLAVLEGSAVTALRTAATSAVATDLLARPQSSRLAILGAGTQARSHLRAMCAVRPITSAVFYSPHPQHAKNLVAELHREWQQVNLSVASSAAEALRDADIICTVTNSRTSVINDQAVPPGCHINAIGSYQPEVAEIPTATVQRAKIYVDHRATALAEAGDLIQPMRRGEIDESDVLGELGELLLGLVPGRTGAQQVTLFKSVGNTVQDVVAAHAIVANATRLGLGTRVSLR